MSAKAEVPVGQKFGEITIIGRAPNPEGRTGCFVFTRCDCGSEQRMTLRSIVKRGVSRCSTSRHFDRSRLEQGEQLIGRKFGLLTVIGAVADPAPDHKGKTQVLVRCDCGVERFAIVNHLMRGNIKTCGGDAHGTIKVQATRWSWSSKSPLTYAIEAVGSGLVKIGSTRELKDRLFRLQYPCPVELMVVAVCDDNIERRMHALLAAHRAHGEWFHYNDHVRRAIAEHMRPETLSVLAAIGRGSRGRTKGMKYKCKRCGEVGHFAKTCGRVPS